MDRGGGAGGDGEAHGRVLRGGEGSVMIADPAGQDGRAQPAGGEARSQQPQPGRAKRAAADGRRGDHDGEHQDGPQRVLRPAAATTATGRQNADVDHRPRLRPDPGPVLGRDGVPGDLDMRMAAEDRVGLGDLQQIGQRVAGRHMAEFRSRFERVRRRLQEDFGFGHVRTPAVGTVCAGLPRDRAHQTDRATDRTKSSCWPTLAAKVAWPASGDVALKVPKFLAKGLRFGRARRNLQVTAVQRRLQRAD